MKHTQYRPSVCFVFVLTAFLSLSGLTAHVALAEDVSNAALSSTNTAPVITLNGASTITLGIGEAFTDPGVTATDPEGDTVTIASSTTPGNIDTSAEATFTIHYTATDPSGLSATTVRQVIVASTAVAASDLSLTANAEILTSTGGTMHVVAIAVTCASESDLPNWGDKGPAITSTTATQHIAAHPSCHLVSGWNFQWGYGVKPGFSGVQDPGPAFTGPVSPAGDPYNTWKSFGPTNPNGVASFSITDLQGANDVWVREELPAGYLPFSEAPHFAVGHKNAFSAEMYCSDDVLNYDNYDAIYGAQLDHTYYCVTFNVPTTPVNPPTATNTAPIINIIGNNPITVTVNTTYIDPGATATDTEDGDITAHITASSTVSTTTIGTYAVVYTVTDSGGLTATSTRTVNVVAASSTATNTPPVITILGDNPVTININTTYTDAGASSTDAEDGDLTSLIVATGTVSTTTVGTYTITYTVTDSGGLTATSTRTVNVVDPSSNGGGTPGGGGGGGGVNIGIGGGFGTPLFASSFAGVGGIGGNISAPLSCPLLRDYLRFGANNDPTEVVKLQAFLQRTEGYDIDVNGTFDQKTLDGVHAFQTKYLTQVMGPWDATQSSGYVYITTKKKINEIACAEAFIINSSEQAIIDAYVAAQNGTENFGPGENPTGNQDIGLNSTSSGIASNDLFNNPNTASVGDASILARFWSFLKSLFGFDN